MVLTLGVHGKRLVSPATQIRAFAIVLGTQTLVE